MAHFHINAWLGREGRKIPGEAVSLNGKTHSGDGVLLGDINYITVYPQTLLTTR